MHNKPPHPKFSFFSGNYFDFYQDQLHFLTECAEKYGDFVYLRFFHIPIYVLNSASLAEKFFQNESAFLRKPKTVRTPLQKQIFGNGLLASEGDFWLQQRRALQKVFNSNYLQSYAKSITKITSEHLTEWRDGEQRVITNEFPNLTLKIASEVFFGTNNLEDIQVVRQLSESLKTIFSSQNRFYWFADNFLPTKKNLQFNKAVANVDDLVDKLIKQKSQNADNNLLSVLLAIENERQRPVSEKQIRDEIVTFFIAGHETTAITLTWIWILLSDNPDALKALKREIKEILGNKLPEFSDLSKLVYLRKVIKESLRLFPPNRSVARETTKEIIIQGWRVPKGSQIVVSQWVLHRDKRYFESPEVFLPERWTEEFEKSLPKFAYFPFGIGNRVCIGQSFAMTEVSLILAIIIQRVEISLDSNQSTEPVPVILLRPKDSLTATLKVIK